MSHYTKITLNKTVYGSSDALEALDEEFGEFAINKYTIKEFFDLYSRFFYDIDEDTHKYFIVQSANLIYPMGYINPLIIEIETVEKDIIATQTLIDSLPKENYILKNGLFLMDNRYQDSPLAKLKEGNNVYIMQSGKKRKIRDYQTYLNIKTQQRSNIDGQNLIQDENFIIFIHEHTIRDLASGPDIISEANINISNLEINIYPRTLEDYNSQMMNILNIGGNDYNTE